MNLLGLESDVRSCVSFVAEVAIRISSHLDWEGSEEHTSELQSRLHLVCRLLLEKKTKPNIRATLLALLCFLLMAAAASAETLTGFVDAPGRSVPSSAADGTHTPIVCLPLAPTPD